MSKPYSKIKKVFKAKQEACISRDDLEGVSEKELQKILKMTLSINEWSIVVSKIVDENADLPDFLHRITEMFNETTTFSSWYSEVEELKLEEMQEAKESLMKSRANIDFMLDFIERKIEKRETANRFWRNMGPNQ